MFGGGFDLSIRPSYTPSLTNPVACCELATTGRLPPYVPEMMRDWILGEVAASGRPRASLVAVMAALHARGGSPLGQAKLAREAGLANNTVAAGYVELLADLMCVGISPAWDEGRKVTVARRPAKFPLINLLAAVAWAPSSPRSVEEFRALPTSAQGRWWDRLARRPRPSSSPSRFGNPVVVRQLDRTRREPGAVRGLDARLQSIAPFLVALALGCQVQAAQEPLG